MTTFQIPARLACAGLCILAALFASSPLQGQGVRYAFVPSATYRWWHADLGLDDALMLGGRTVIDFGPLVALEGHALFASDVGAHFTTGGVVDSSGAALDQSSIAIQDYGLALRLNFGSGGMIPFLRAGGGVLRFDGGADRASRQIALSYGAGIRLNAARRVHAEIFASDSRFRLDRSAIHPAALPGSDPRRDDRRRSLALNAGLGLMLGGRSSADEPRERWSAASVPIEPFVGRLGFSDADVPRQTVAGVRGGLDVGNHVGLRAYYLRGAASKFPTLDGVRSVGGEAQFNLNTAARLAPYLVLGGGSLDFATSDSTTAVQPADRTAMIVGGGIGLRLTDQFRVNLGVRDFIHSRAVRLADADRVGDLAHDLLFSTGVTFSLGRGRRTIPVAAPPSAGISDATRGLPSGVRRDSTWRTPRQAHDSLAATDSAAFGGRSPYHSPTSVVIPLPTEGALYIRYGPPRTGDSLALAGEGTSAGATVARPEALQRQADSLLIRRLIDAEMHRWRLEVAAATGVATRSAAPTQIVIPPASAAPAAPIIISGVAPVPAQGQLVDSTVVRLLAEVTAQRDMATADNRRLRQQVDLLEATLRDSATAARLARDRAATDARIAAGDSAVVVALARARDSTAVARAEGEAARSRSLARWIALRDVGRATGTVSGITQSDRGLTLVLGGGVFATGHTVPGAAHDPALTDIARLLALYPTATVTIDGHTDASGSASANQRLSSDRANAVRARLVSLGVAADRLVVAGHGALRPVADNRTAAGRSANRRVEITMIGVTAPTDGTP